MSEYTEKNQRHIILPDDPDWNQPIVMRDPYAERATPKLAQQARNEELDQQRESELKKLGADFRNFKYANSAIAHAPDAFMHAIRVAQTAGVSNMMTNPMWFSPLHTPQNWQIAAKRREVYNWLFTSASEILLPDYTFKPINELDFDCDSIIEDSHSGDMLFESIQSEPIIGGSGETRKPRHFSTRVTKEKRCFRFTATGYWRGCEVSEEHPMVVLDGDAYRHNLKLARDQEYRKSQNENLATKTKRVDLPEKLITRKRADAVSLNDYLLSPVPKVGDVHNEKAWLIGLLLADGHFGVKDNKQICLTLNKSESFIDDAEAALSKYGNRSKITKFTHSNSKNTWRLQVSSATLHSDLTAFIIGKYGHKRLTHKAFSLDRESRLHLLGGYFDGDGSFSNQRKLIANCCSKDMSDQIYWLLLSVGIRASLKRHPILSTIPTSSECHYRITIPQSDVPLLRPYMHSDKVPAGFMPKRSRQLRFFYEEDGSVFLAQPIKEIAQFSYSGIGYDLQIDPERSLVASGYVASNCRFFYTNEPKVAAAIDFYCFTPDTQILMANGTQKSISSINVGDIVRSHDGTSNRVVRKFERQANEHIVKLYISGISSNPLKCSEEHKLIVYKNNKTTFVKAKDICVGDYLVTPALFEENETGPKVSDDLAWLIGIYAAEGCGIPYEHTDKDGKLEQHFKGVYFTINISEEGLAKQISDRILRLYGRMVHIHRLQDGSMRLAVYGVDIADDLHGLCPGTSKYGSKRLAPHVLKWHRSNLKNILCGFMSGDGCFNKKNGLQGAGVSKTLCEQMANICDRLGLAYSFTATRLPESRQVAYNVRISRASCDQIRENCYKISDTNIDETHSKNNPYSLSEKFIIRKVRKIKTESYAGVLHDMEVENTHTYVANRIACSNSQFPMNGFSLECSNRKIEKWFDHNVVKKLRLNNFVKETSSEYFMIGDVFIHRDIECPKCHGTAIDPDNGKTCNHPAGRIRKLLILNPDYIEVQHTPLVDEPSIVYVPDEDLKRIVMYRQPKAIYDKLPDAVKKAVMTQKPIPLSNRTISHLKHMPVPYGTYGSSLIRRLFTTLAYKTKIMTANWIVAERLILPVRVVKIGSDQRPATSADIADMQQQLAATANDPNLTIVTHHNFEYEWYGACFDLNTYVLTTYGWKLLAEIEENEVIATYNRDSGALEFQKIQAKQEYDFKSSGKLKMIHFNQRSVDVMVTPEHRMLVERNGEMQVVKSQEVRHYDKFISQVKWNGIVPAESDLPYKSSPLSHLSLDEYLEFAGYYISEGGSKRELSRGLSKDKQIQAAGISQNIDSLCYERIASLTSVVYPNLSVHKDERRNIPTHTFIMNNVEIARYLSLEFGMVAGEKKIPAWMKNLPVEKLSILHNALMAGDGDTREDTKKPRFRYTTTSLKLADDISEICLKLGYWPSVSKELCSNDTHPGRNDIYRVYWSERRKNTKLTINKNNIYHEDYNDKVYCVTVPNGFFLTRRNGKITVQGNSGKILQVTQELEHIDKEILDGMMLNEALLNGEGCIPAEDRILTRLGPKNLSEISLDDEIATFNKETGNLEYQNAEKIHEYDFDGNLIQFRTNKIDFLCTPQHRMLFQKRDHDEWDVDIAANVRDRAKFHRQVKWNGNKGPEFIDVGGNFVPLDLYLRLLSLYVTEGYVRFAPQDECNGKKPARSLHVYQTHKGKAFEKCCDLFPLLPWKYTHDTKAGAFHIYNSALAAHMKEACGHGSCVKRIPQWIKNLSTDKLRVFLEDLIDGDGSYRNDDSYKYSTYYTRSKYLCQDVVEIAIKCGYWPKYTHSEKRGYEITFSDFDLEQKTYTLESKKFETITEVHYVGKVWCVTVPNSFILTERNGHLMISGNSGYQSGAVGVEALIRRIESWRDKLAEYIEEEIFKPIAQMQGFVDEEATQEVGETVWLYPTIKWNDLNLRDKTQLHQNLMQLHDKQVLSTRTLLEELGFNYDQEVKRLRYEQVNVGPMGGQLGGGMGGGAGGGMGGPGGGPGGMPMPGGPPGMGGPGGMPGGPGGMPGGGGTDSMGIGPGMMPGAGSMAAGQKVTKKGKGKSEEEMPQVPMMPVRLTRIEQDMAEMLVDVSQAVGISSDNIRVQFPVENPQGGKPIAIDFAMPMLRLGVECLHPETLVSTSSGTKPAKDVLPDDRLYSCDGTEMNIKSVILNEFDGHLVDIKAGGMLPIKLTPNHPVLICRPETATKHDGKRNRKYVSFGKPLFIEAADICKGDYLVVPKRRGEDAANTLCLIDYNGTAHNSFKLTSYKLEEKLGWLLGVYVAEGSCNPNKRSSTIEFSFGSHEKELIEKTLHFIRDVFALNPARDISRNGGTKVRTCCKSLARFLSSSFGIHASSKHLSSWLYAAPINFKKAFLDGFCDGDGCIRMKNGTRRLITSSQQLAVDIQSLIMTMGYWASIVVDRKPGTITRIHDTYYQTKGLWEVNVNFFGNRKGRHREDKLHFFAPVTAITKTKYKGTVYNFETNHRDSNEPESSNHTYTVANIAVHNCDGSIWHDNPKQAAHDKERDEMLAMRGWTILRFDDKIIDEAPQAVKSTIGSYMSRAIEKFKAGKKEASGGEAYYYTTYADNVIEVYAMYDQLVKGA